MIRMAKQSDDLRIRQRMCGCMKEKLNLTLTWEKLQLVSDIFNFNCLIFLQDVDSLKRMRKSRMKRSKVKI